MQNLNASVDTAAERKALRESFAREIGAVVAVKGRSFTEERQDKLAIMLESTRRELDRAAKRLNEATQVADIGTFRRYAFDIIPAVLSNVIAEEIVSVQPLKQKIGQIFYLKYIYGSDKGKIKAGDVISSPQVARPAGYAGNNYSSELVEGEILTDTPAASYTGASALILSYYPVRPKTVKIQAGNTVFTDEAGNGALTAKTVAGAAVGGASGSVEYETGKVTLQGIPTFTGSAVEATYEYNMEITAPKIAEVDIKVEEAVVVARTRKLKALYAFDAAYDLEMSQGVNIDNALLETITNEIKNEIDGEIIQDLYTQAALATSWDIKQPDYIASQEFHYKTFITKIIEAANMIFQQTRRAVGNFIITGEIASNVLETIGEPRFKPATSSSVGPHFSGTLDGKFKVYKNPYFKSHEFLVGYKGTSMLDSGYVWAPYLPIYSTNLIMLDDFVGRRGFATSNGKKMINPLLYVKGTIVDTTPQS